MLETPSAEIHAYNGADADTASTALPQHIYTLIRGAVPSRQSLRRIGGKILHTNFENPVIGIVQMGDKFIVQAYTDLIISDL